MIELQPSIQEQGARGVDTPAPYRITSMTEVWDRAELDALLEHY